MIVGKVVFQEEDIFACSLVDDDRSWWWLLVLALSSGEKVTTRQTDPLALLQKPKKMANRDLGGGRPACCATCTIDKQK